MPEVDATARRTRAVTCRDIELYWRFLAPVRPGDEITAEVEVLEAREDKPITKAPDDDRSGDGVTVLDGHAVVWSSRYSRRYEGRVPSATCAVCESPPRV